MSRINSDVTKTCAIFYFPSYKEVNAKQYNGITDSVAANY